MKKTTYMIAIIAAILLIGCGGADSSETTAETLLSDTVNDETLTNETPNLQPDSDNEKTETAEETTETNIDTDKSSSNNDIPDIESDKNVETSLPEYTVNTFEETKTMYTTDSLNVRKGPSTDFEIIGGLARGREVTVIGQADTAWYEIQYGEDKAFVCNDYLQDEKPIVPAAEIIFVGDSRFVQMKNSVGKNSYTWVAESGKGYNWFSKTAIAQIDSCAGNGSKILINLGVNDLGNLQKYISLVNAKADEWTEKGATVYYASVNPVLTYNNVTEDQVEYFNSQMQANLNDNVHWIDSHSYLVSVGYRLVDGLHYSTETYQTIYAYYMSYM